jgi:urease accessory protein UreH
MAQENRKRQIQVTFRVSAEEKSFIQKKMRLAGMNNMRRYALQMATKGYVINVDFSELKNLGSELQKIDRNVRQILKHVDAAGLIYAADAEDIRNSLKECWQLIRREYQRIMRYMK